MVLLDGLWRDYMICHDMKFNYKYEFSIGNNKLKVCWLKFPVLCVSFLCIQINPSYILYNVTMSYRLGLCHIIMSRQHV